jgi:hypothetical protein
MRKPALLCAIGAVAMSLALQKSSGMYDLPSLWLATAASICALLAAVFSDSVTERNYLAPQLVFGGGFLYGLYCHVFQNPAFYADQSKLRGFRGLALVALIIGAAYLCVHLRASLQKARFIALLLVFAVMGVALIRASPRPFMDVWVDRQLGARALAEGQNPYSVTYPDIYRRGNQPGPFYDPRLLKNGRVIAYPYLPLTVMLDRLTFGDVRYISLLFMLIAAWTLARLGPGATGELAALALLYQGRSFFLLEQGWTEPQVLAAFTVALWCASRPSKRWPQWLAIGLSLGVLAASKQYSPLLILPLWMVIPKPLRLRASLLGLLVVALTIIPFWIWDREGLLRGIVYMQIWQPPRLDALSWMAFWGRTFGPPPFLLSPAALAALLALGLGLRWQSSTGRAAATAAAAWLLFVLFNKQAFCNYDWLGGGLLCAAAAAFSKEVAS